MPALERYDLAIVGAGAAGCAAAWSAVRASNCSVRVLLLDQSPHAGGVVTAAMHRSLCGLYASEPRDPRETLNAGAQRHAVEAMCAIASDAVRTRTFGPANVLEFPPRAWQAALDKLCDHPDITRRLGARVTSIERVGRRIVALRTGVTRIEAAAFIDCTGVGSLLTLAGEDVARPLDAERPLGGFAIRFDHLRGNVESLRLAIPLTLTRAARAGALPPSAALATFYPGPGESSGVLKLAIAPGEDVAGIAAELVAHLRSQLATMQSATVIETSPAGLPRDGRRLLGCGTLTEDDVLAGVRRPDAVAIGWWPIEWWGGAGPTYEYPPAARPYGITAAMLRSVAVDNLFAAGVCLSATARAAASARVSGICLATGDAVGRVAITL